MKASCPVFGRMGSAKAVFAREMLKELGSLADLPESASGIVRFARMKEHATIAIDLVIGTTGAATMLKV